MILRCQAPGSRKPGEGSRLICLTRLGESAQEVEFAGVFRRWTERELIDGDRDVRKCPRCGFWNAFQPIAIAQVDRAVARA